MQCSDRLRQQALALQNSHATHGTFPAGRIDGNGLDHSWCTAILPYLEQGQLASQIDLKLPWDEPGPNRHAAETVLPIFRCPSSVVDFLGDTDYGGMRGSLMSGIGWNGKGGVLGSGVMITVGTHSDPPVAISEITDGTSQTICIAEVADRSADEHGMWADGRNAFSHDNGPINAESGGEMSSLHPGGAYAAFADGSVHFLSESISRHVLGALCTRAGREPINAADW